MALVIALIRLAEECERADRAQDREYVNGEKLFSSSSSAQYTEVEYATERYSESPVGTKTDKGVKGEPAQRKRLRGFAHRIHGDYDSSSDEPLIASKSFYLREIHRQIDHNDMLQRRLAHSTKLLHDVERIAMGDGNDLAPQAVVPLPLFHRLIGSNSTPARYAVQLEPLCSVPQFTFFVATVPWPPSAAYAPS
jgi:hypothetical protein